MSTLPRLPGRVIPAQSMIYRERWRGAEAVVEQSQCKSSFRHYYVPRSSLCVMSTSPKPIRRPNDPPFLILTSLAEGPKHGHALLKDIETFAGVKLGPGTLYGAITRLEESGLIEALPADNRRNPYRITTTGTNVLRDVIVEMRTISDTGAKRLGFAFGTARA